MKHITAIIIIACIPGCAGQMAAKLHLKNAVEGHQNFLRMRQTARYTAQDLLIEQLKHANTEKEKDDALQAHFLNDDTIETISDAHALWLMNMTSNAALLEPYKGLFGILIEEIQNAIQPNPQIEKPNHD